MTRTSALDIQKRFPHLHHMRLAWRIYTPHEAGMENIFFLSAQHATRTSDTGIENTFFLSARHMTRTSALDIQKRFPHLHHMRLAWRIYTPHVRLAWRIYFS